MEATQFPTQWAAAAGLVVAVLYYTALLLRWRAQIQSNTREPPLPPGPTGLPIVGSLPFLDPQLHHYFTDLAKTHGPIYSIKLGSKLGVVISSPALAREALRDNDAALANRDIPSVGRIIAYGGNDIVWSPNGPTWRMLRRVCVQRMLSPSTLDAFYHLRRREVRSTVKHLYQLAEQPCDVGAVVFLSVMNVITSMLWGGTVDDDDERGAIGREFKEVVGEITELLGKPNLSDFFPAMERFDLQGFGKKMRVLREKFDRIFEGIIERRKRRGRENNKGEGEGEDMLGFMLELEGQVGADGGVSFTMTHVKALLMDMVVGGTDTTSNTVEWAMAEMMQMPETMKRAQEELEEVVGKNNIVEESHITKLSYLGAVIKETLRLHPALPLLVPHCPSSSVTIGGYTIPQGSRVFVNPWAIHRDPSVWENPSEFKPMRFLDANKRWDFNGSDFMYIPFGSGRRICAGISMAERMSLFTLASLLHQFDWRLSEGIELDLSEKFGIVLKKAKPLVAIPTPRLTNLELYC